MNNSPGLMSSISLLKGSFEVTKSKAKVLYGIIALNYVLWLAFALIVVASLFGGKAIASINGIRAGGAVSLILFVVLIIVSLRMQIAVYEAIINDLSFSQAISASKGKIGRFFWTSFLAGLIIMLGIILFIIPGIIFAVWYSFSAFVVVVEGLSGSKALQQSKNYVTGRWGHVAWRLFVLAVLTWLVIVATQALASVFFGKDVAAIVNGVVSFLVIPFGQVYTYLLYKNLKETPVSLYTPPEPILPVEGQVS